MKLPRRRWCLCIALLLAPALASGAEASTADEDASKQDEPRQAPVEEEVFRPVTSGPFVTFTAPLTPARRIVVQPILSVTAARGSFDANGRLEPLGPGEASTASALAVFSEYGLHERMTFGAQLNVGLNGRTVEGASASSLGFADGSLFARGLVLKETPRWVPELTVLGQVKLPFGRATSESPARLGTDVFGTGTVDLTVGLDMTKGIRPVVLHLDLLYTRLLPTRLNDVELQYGDVFAWSLSGELPFAGGRFAAMAEVSGRHQGPLRTDGVAAPSASHDVLVGIGLEVIFSPDVQLLIGYQRNLWGRNVTATDSLVATVVPVF